MPGQNATLTFSGTAGNRVSLLTQFSSGLVHYCNTIQITAPDGTTKLYNSCAYNSSDFSNAVSLPTTGTYKITMVTGANVTGTATFTLYNVPPDAGGPITPGGSPVAANITVPGQNATLTFSGTAGNRVSLLTQFSSGLVHYCNTIQVIEPDGATKLYNSCQSNNSDFSNALTLPATGTYTITMVTGADVTGTATFTLYSVPPDTGGPITPGGSPVTANITVPGQNALLTFSGTAGNRVSLLTQFSSGLVHYCNTIQIIEPDGATKLYNSCQSNNSDFSNALTLPTTGTYTIATVIGTNVTGSATFTLYSVPPDAGGPITPGGSPVAANITVPGQNALLSFSGTAGNRISLLTQFTSGLVHYCNTIQIIEPDGVTKLYNSCQSNNSDFSNALTLPTTGTYKITMVTGTNVTGTATFTLYSVPPDATGSVTIGGVGALLTTTAPGQGMQVTFAGTTSQTVKVSVSANAAFFANYYTVKVLNPSGSVLSSTTSFNANYVSGTLTLPQNGTYTIVVYSTGTATGSATIGVAPS